MRPFALVTRQFQAYGTEGSFTQSFVRMRPGTEIVVQFPLWNDGRVPVRIEGLDPATYQPGSSVVYRLVGIGSMLGWQTGYPSEAFSPFTLAPGEGIQLFLGITPGSANWAKGTTVGFNTIALSYQTLWTHHTATIPIGQSIQICRGGCSV